MSQPRTTGLANAGKTHSSPSWLPTATIALGIVAFGLYWAGTTIARRDLSLDGNLLYIARFVQLFACLGIAYAFRNHIPSAERLLASGAVALALSVGVDGAAAIAQDASYTLGVVAAILSGTANAVCYLLLYHFFSTYKPSVSAVAIVAAEILRETIFASSLLWSQEAIVVAQIVARAIGLVALAGALALKETSMRESWGERPIQHGITLDDSTTKNPFAFLASSSEWVFQMAVAIVLPFIFGFMSQLLSTGGLSDGLHRENTELWAIASLLILLAVTSKKKAPLSFNDFFVTMMLLYGLGLLILPFSWANGSGAGSILLKCASVLYEAMLFILLAHKAYDDARHTYLYFGVFTGVSNVNYARFLEPIMMDGVAVDVAVLSSVSLCFLFSMMCLCLLLFMLQRTKYSSLEASQGVDSRNSVHGDYGFTLRIDELSTAARLTEREREVLGEVLHGFTMPNVAGNLGISAGTVKTHMKNIYRKTQTANKQELIQLIDTGVFSHLTA